MVFDRGGSDHEHFLDAAAAAQQLGGRERWTGLGASVLEVSYWGLSLVPLLAVRKGLTPRGGDADQVIRFGFRPPGRLAHAALRALMRAETALLPRCPLGTSLLLAARRNPLGAGGE